MIYLRFRYINGNLCLFLKVLTGLLKQCMFQIHLNFMFTHISKFLAQCVVCWISKRSVLGSSPIRSMPVFFSFGTAHGSFVLLKVSCIYLLVLRCYGTVNTIKVISRQ